MATKKIKFPQYSHSEMLKLIYDRNSTRAVRLDDSEALDRGQFVLAWDSDTAADDYPILGALCSITQKRCGEMSYEVLCEGGYHASYKHARIIESSQLPSVVVLSTKVGRCECIGKLVGFFFDSKGKAFVTVIDRNNGVIFFEPEEVAYLDDVKFGIVNEEDNGNC